MPVVDELEVIAFPEEIWRRAAFFRSTKKWWYEPVWVLRVTPHQVVVEDIKEERFTLDRDRLEENGRFHHRKGGLFCLKKGEDSAHTEKEWYDKHAGTEAAKVLKLSEPVTKDTVLAAFKEIAVRHHPDFGGDHYEFMAIQSAYESLMERMH